MKAVTLYPFATGDRLNERNTYFYVPFCGLDFIMAWQKSRSAACEGLMASAPIPLVPAIDVPSVPFDTRPALDSLYAALRRDPADAIASELTRILLQRFEVTKRLYSAYNERFRAAVHASYDDLSLYLSFAQVLELSYSEQGKLYFLNGLLKINDTLVSLRPRLTLGQREALAWLLDREVEHVTRLGARRGIAL